MEEIAMSASRFESFSDFATVWSVYIRFLPIYHRNVSSCWRTGRPEMIQWMLQKLKDWAFAVILIFRRNLNDSKSSFLKSKRFNESLKNSAG